MEAAYSPASAGCDEMVYTASGLAPSVCTFLAFAALWAKPQPASGTAVSMSSCKYLRTTSALSSFSFCMNHSSSCTPATSDDTYCHGEVTLATASPTWGKTTILTAMAIEKKTTAYTTVAAKVLRTMRFTRMRVCSVTCVLGDSRLSRATRACSALSAWVSFSESRFIG